MKTRFSFISILILLLAGCASRPPADWNARVGHYTYQQAVEDLGQPDRQAQLANGATQFRWFFHPPNTGNSFAAGGMDNNPGDINGLNHSMAMSRGVSPQVNNRYLELTFDSNGVLTAWSKNY